MSTENKLIIAGEQARIIIKNCHLLLRGKMRGTELWHMVSKITGHGSGYSVDICTTANLDPHQIIQRYKPLKDLNEKGPLK